MKTCFILLLCASGLHAASPDEVIAQWLAHQTNINTWSADFSQTRHLKALNQPLVSTGQVWFAAPQNFRWELGTNQTIAIRNEDTMWVVYPNLKRAEKYNFASIQNNQWRDSLALLQSGFPRSRAELDAQFKILSLATTNHIHRLELEPRSTGARKLMPRINLYLNPTDYILVGTELVFADGSRMRNDFTNPRLDADVRGKFNFDPPADYKLIKPLESK